MFGIWVKLVLQSTWVDKIPLSKMPQHLFLLVLKPGNARSRRWQTQCLVRAHFLIHGRPSSHFVSHGRGVRLFSEVFFIKALCSFTRAPFLGPNYHPEALSPDTITRRIRFKREFCRDTDIQPIAFRFL